MSGQTSQQQQASVFGLYTITAQITPERIRLEITKPCQEHAGWLTLLDAIADRWGSYGTVGERQTFWAEVELPLRSCQG